MEWVNGIPIGIAYFQRLEDIAKLESDLAAMTEKYETLKRHYAEDTCDLEEERDTIRQQTADSIIGLIEEMDAKVFHEAQVITDRIISAIRKKFTGGESE